VLSVVRYFTQLAKCDKVASPRFVNFT